jgi:hypothetical protein
MLAEPALNAVTSEYQTRTYGTTFRTVLDTLVRMLPNIRRIHIFYAGPATLAFHLGRQISKSIHPHVTVYNYMAKDCPPYSWGLTITSDLHASDFLIQPTSTKEVP